MRDSKTSLAIIFSPMHEKANLFSAADLALAASGTVALELAGAQVPTVVGYKVHPLSYIIAQRLVKVKWISLANIILEEEVIPEFIQHRHSQSVLSLIVKKAGSKLLSAYESEWAINDKGKRTYDHLNNFPIIASSLARESLIVRCFGPD